METRWSGRPVVTFGSVSWSVDYQRKILSCFYNRATEKAALGLISSLIRRMVKISDKDIWRREMHNSRWSRLQSEMFSLDCFGQHAPSDEQCMQRSQAGGRTDSAQTQTQQKAMNLCCNANGPGAFCFKESWTKGYNFCYCQLKKCRASFQNRQIPWIPSFISAS